MVKDEGCIKYSLYVDWLVIWDKPFNLELSFDFGLFELSVQK